MSINRQPAIILVETEAFSCKKKKKKIRKRKKLKNGPLAPGVLRPCHAMLLVLLIPLLTHSFFSDNLLAKFWPWMCSLSFIFLLWVDHLLSTGPHSHQQALDACLKHFVGSMISLMKVLLNCSSIIACLICLWSLACSWSHLLARSLCHPLFHLTNLSQGAITRCLLAKSLVFSWTHSFDRLIARSLARPLSR